jgi:hypothetical protein
MKLDDRIINPLEIYSPVNAMLAQVYIGQNGIFSNDSQDFENLKNAELRVLTDLELREGYIKRFCGDGRFWYEYFLPLANVEPKKEKKFRPYTFKEFFNKFIVGQPIRHRRKADAVERYLILNGYVDDKEVHYQYVHIGNIPYSLDELFNEYEYQNTLGKWVPFGVEE